MVDAGWLGLHPLEKHVVICGFPRSGSTLLLLVLECCVARARTFGKGQPALATAQRAYRNHAMMITKRPRDLFDLADLRQHYERQGRVQLCVVLTTRDPRAILTSHHANSPSNYYVTTERWLTTYQAFVKETARRDVMAVRFEDLVLTPAAIEQQMTEFIGWTLRRPFDRYYEEASRRRLKTRLTQNLNGVRPLDPGSLDKWKAPIHRARIRQILAELPRLPDYLVELGYERDDHWTRDYA